MNTIKLSEIKNMQDLALTKSGELCDVELLLLRIKTQKRGRKPTLYYKGKEVISDVAKEDIEEIVYCEHCGYQTLSENYKSDDECPNCGDSHAYGWSGVRLKGTQHQIYSEDQWNKFSDNFKKQFVCLERFKESC